MKTLLEHYKSNPIKICRYASVTLFCSCILFELAFKAPPSNFFLNIIILFSLPSAILIILISIRKIRQNKTATIISSFLLANLAIITGGLSLSLARRLIHSAMGIDPSFFPASQTVLSAIFILPGWILILSFALLLISLAFLGITERINKTKFRFSFFDFFGTAMGILGIIFIGGYISTAVISKTYFSADNKKLYLVVRDMVILLDFYNGKECSNISQKKLFCYIGENRIAVADDNAITIKKCNHKN